MYLPVRVTPVLLERDGGYWVSIRVTQGDGAGAAEAVPWDRFMGVEHRVDLAGPAEKATKVSRKQIKRRSSKQERLRIEAVGGRRHAGSGSLSGYKSDGSVGYRYRMENKFTMAASYRVTLSDLLKLRSECINGQVPVFNVDFQDKVGNTKDSWVLVPSKEWERLVNESSDNG